MKIKALSLLLALISCVALFVVPVSASGDIEFSLDVNDRDTDISYQEEDETNVYGEVVNAEEQKELETKRNVYIFVLVILLIISVAILVVTIKRAKQEKDAIGKPNEK